MITKYGDEIPAIDKAIEECAEVLQVLMKIKRFGLFDKHPVLLKTNHAMLNNELADLEYAITEIYNELGE